LSALLVRQLAVIGCGLIGGSFALALKRRAVVGRVLGYSPSAGSVQAAQRIGAIDMGADSIAAAARGADLVLLAVPVAATASVLSELRPAAAAGALLIDVGSTKADVAAAAIAVLGENAARFVPCHPIAGKASAGVQHAEATLFDGRTVAITPLDANQIDELDRARAIWESTGAQVRTMNAATHDAAMAAVSHLPHLIAFAYMQGLLAQDDAADVLALAGPGFRDFSRIAAGDPVLWRDVLLTNRAEVLRRLQHFRSALQQAEALIAAGDAAALQALIAECAEARAAWPAGSR
jgi:prephenate dehydrogenase